MIIVEIGFRYNLLNICRQLLAVYLIFTLLELELFPTGVLNETKPYHLAVMKNSKQLEMIRRMKCYDSRYGASIESAIQIPLDCTPFKQCGSYQATSIEIND